MGLQRVGHNWATFTVLTHHTPGIMASTSMRLPDFYSLTSLNKKYQNGHDLLISFSLLYISQMFQPNNPTRYTLYFYMNPHHIKYSFLQCTIKAQCKSATYILIYANLFNFCVSVNRSKYFNMILYWKNIFRKCVSPVLSGLNHILEIKGRVLLVIAEAFLLI